jgi:hypothetical protein
MGRMRGGRKERGGMNLALLDGGTFQGTKKTANLFAYAKVDILVSNGRL